MAETRDRVRAIPMSDGGPIWVSPDMVFIQPLPDKDNPQPGTPTPEDPSGHDPVDEDLPDEGEGDPSETRSPSGYARRSAPEESP